MGFNQEERFMKKNIAIIGLGNVGSALAEGFAAKGHAVVFGVREPGSAKNKAALAKLGGKVKAVTIAEAVRASDIVVLAVPWSAAQQTIEAAGGLGGKILIDCINPLTPDLKGLALGTTTSAAESIAAWAPRASVVKAFNTVGADDMRNPVFGDQHLTMFLCGNDAGAKKSVSELAADIGFEPIDAGPLPIARTLEPLALLWIHLAVFEKFGPGFGLRLIRK
jgi:hypothetical protein